MSSQVLRPYVRISQLQDNKEITNTALISEIIEKSENLDDEEEKTPDPGALASWINQRHPLGQIFDLGVFQKRVSSAKTKLSYLSRTLKIEVYHAKKTSDHLLLGTCLIDCDKLIDLKSFAFE